MEQQLESPHECAQRVKQYIDWKNKDFQTRLSFAGTIGDMRDVLVAYTKPEFNLMTLFTSPSPYAVEVVEELKAMAESAQGKTEEPIISAPQKQIPKRTEDVYSKSGELLYRRSPRRDFTQKEQVFLQQASKRKLSAHETTELFNKQFQARTESSIMTKRYRVAKRGLTG